VATEAEDLKVQRENEEVRALKGAYKYGWHDEIKYSETPQRGLSHEVIDKMSDRKGEPDWMRRFRHKALDTFYRKPMPAWGADLSGINFDDIYYYIRPDMGQVKSWDDMPEDIKATWDKLGIPEAEKNYLGGVTAQYESEVVYHKTQEELERQGILFMDMDSALRDHPDIVKQYFGTIIPPADNKFSALNSAVWSGGSFIYVPPGVEVEIPLQAYFRINQENMGQFERTLIIVDEGSYVHYVEGCSAYEGAIMEWVDGNLGSKVTMKYPSIYLLGERARGEVLSIAYAGEGQHQDAGGKVIHAAPNTSSAITSKSISKDGGRAGYRGLLKIDEGAARAKSHVICDALILDDKSRSDTYPYIEIEEESAAVSHEASVSKVSDEQLFYLMSRGLDETEAMQMIVRGFIEPITRELPMEYAVELQRLVELQMEGSVG
jgi:Fe-S cluster assembly protein SufB